MNRLHIFRSGRHTATDGQSYEFSEADLTAIAAAYDPAKHEAPLVVGHPKHDDPAYGWVASLSAGAAGLQAEPDQVEPAFAEMVAAGRFKKISASLYPPKHPSNPVPEGWYLRHVGFLGAQPPAVKGLKSAAFAEADGAIEFMEHWQQRSVQSLFRRLREWLIESSGVEKADQVLPDYEITGLDVPSEPAPVPTSYAEGSDPAQTTEGDEMSAEDKARLAALEAEHAALQTQAASFAEREARIAAAERAARVNEIAEFVGGLVTGGKVLPKDQAGLVAFMAGPNEAGVIEFGEGESKKSQAPNEWLRAFLVGLPKQVEFSELSAGKGGTPNLADPKEIAKRATEFQETESKAGRTISISEAVEHVTKGVQP